MELRALPGVGVEVLGMSAAAISRLDADSPVLNALSVALREHSLLWLHASEDTESSMSPQLLRDLYGKLHTATFPQVPCVLPPDKPLPPSAGGNLRGRCFPGFPETNVLGHAETVADWHGLSGWLTPTAWWEEARGQWHHDGGFSASAPPPPALVAMHSEEAPTVEGGGTPTTLDYTDARTAVRTQLLCPPGATLFYSTRKALQLSSPEMVARARRLRCCYSEGFGRVQIGEYPRLSDSFLTPLNPPPEARSIEQRVRRQSIPEFESFETLAFGSKGDGPRSDAFYRHRLVQKNAIGHEYAVVHTVCLDHLEEIDEDGVWRSISWTASQDFLEALLAPAATPPHLQLVDWRPGDWIIFDNFATQHTVTATNAYTSSGCRRLMTRTDFQPTTDVLT